MAVVAVRWFTNAAGLASTVIVAAFWWLLWNPFHLGWAVPGVPVMASLLTSIILGLFAGIKGRRFWLIAPGAALATVIFVSASLR